MRILMLGNSFIFTNDLPDALSRLTGAEVMAHTRGGARLAEQLNPKTKMGARTQAALEKESWDYVVLQEMSNGPITAPDSFFRSVRLLCEQIRQNGAIPVLYATWAYQKGSDSLTALGISYEEMARRMSQAYRKAAQENHALLAPVGDRFYELSESRNLYAADGVHPNEEGTQVAAEILSRTIQRAEEGK